MKTILSLTFDDGNSIQYSNFFPILEKYKLKGTFYIITSQIGIPGKLTMHQLFTLYNHGHEIGSHTHTHPHLTKLSKKFVELELKKSREILKKFNPTSLAYPAGDYNEKVVSITKKYYTSARCYCDPNEVVNNGINTGLLSERYTLKTLPIQDFLSDKLKVKNKYSIKWIILVFHGDSSKFHFFSWFFKKKMPYIMMYRTVTLSSIGGFAKTITSLFTKNRKITEPNLEYVCKKVVKSRIKVLTVSEAVSKIYK